MPDRTAQHRTANQPTDACLPPPQQEQEEDDRDEVPRRLHTRTATLTDDWGGHGRMGIISDGVFLHPSPQPPWSPRQAEPTTRDRAEDVRTGTRGDETWPKGRGREKDPTGACSMPSGVADPVCAPPGKKKNGQGRRESDSRHCRRGPLHRIQSSIPRGKASSGRPPLSPIAV
jgi:hypothetical protein